MKFRKMRTYVEGSRNNLKAKPGVMDIGVDEASEEAPDYSGPSVKKSSSKKKSKKK